MKSYHLPTLAVPNGRTCDPVIINAFKCVKKCPLCWLAHEELEYELGALLSKNGIIFSNEYTSILFREQSSGIELAEIVFDKSLNVSKDTILIEGGININ